MFESFKKPKPKPEPEGPLSEDEARDMANMIHAKTGANPAHEGRIQLKTGEWVTANRHEKPLPTAEDYEKALREIEELEKQAGEDTPVKDALLTLKRLILEIPKFDIGGEQRKEWQKKIEEIAFTAKQKLDKLKKEGEEYGDRRHLNEAHQSMMAKIYDVYKIFESDRFDVDGQWDAESKKGVDVGKVAEEYLSKERDFIEKEREKKE